MDSLKNSDSKGINRPTSTLSPTNNSKRRSTVFTIASVFLIFVVVTAFVSYRISSTLSQTSNSGTGLTTNHDLYHDLSLFSSPEHTQSLGIQASHVITDARETDTIINYNEFKQEAQNILFREEEEIIQAQSNPHSVAPTISAEGFRSEADKTLYRDSEY